MADDIARRHNVEGLTTTVLRTSRTLPRTDHRHLATHHRLPDRGTGMSVLVSLPTEVALLGIIALLQSLSSVATTMGSSDPREVMSLLQEEPFDILIIPAGSGSDYDKVLCTCGQKRVRTLALLRDAGEEAVAQAALVAADGFLLEPGLDANALENALRLVSRGEMPLPSSLAQRIITHLRRPRHSTASTIWLTPREIETLQLLADGLSNRQISHRLKISEHGVKRHVANILAKLNCPNRTLAVAHALREGLIKLDSPA